MLLLKHVRRLPQIATDQSQIQ